MQKGRRIQKKAVVCTLLSILFVFSLVNAPVSLIPCRRFLAGEIRFSDLTREIHEGYVSGVSLKSAWIDLNGAYARLTGRRVYRGVSVLKNGMLDREGMEEIDVQGIARALVRLSSALAARGIPVLYVQIPCKQDLAGDLACDGVENAANRNADALCASLADEGVPLLDLRPLLAGSAADVTQYFYRTDHHWNTDGAFLAFGAVLEEIAARLPQRTVDPSLANAAHWDRTVYSDWLLGSHGRRVGRFFGGVDDLVIYTPRDACVTSISIPHKGVERTGDFSDVLLAEEYLSAPDYERDAYCAYLGGNYPLTIHENAAQENSAHVLLIKDSFSLPLEAMLSTALSRLDTVDPRYHTGSVLEYAERTAPDLVIVAINPSVFSDRAYGDFGA